MTPTLKSIQITRFEFYSNISAQVELNLSVTPQVTVRLPKEQEVATLLIGYALSIRGAENALAVELSSQSIFTFDQPVSQEEAASLAQSECVPRVADELSKRLAAITQNMGFSPLSLG